MSDAQPLTVVILTALPVEYKAIYRHLKEVEETPPHKGTVYEQGWFSANGRDWKVGIAEIGAGNPTAAAETERAIEHFDPKYIFFVGVAGGIKDVSLGDIVVATKIYNYESGKDQTEFQTRPNVGNSAYPLVARARADARKYNWLNRIYPPPEATHPRVLLGPIAAGEKVIASTRSATYQFIRSEYSDTLAVDMEGFGFLTASWLNHQVQAIVIRGISDLIDGKSEADEQGSQEMAAAHASAFAFEMLANLDKIDEKEANQEETINIIEPVLPLQNQDTELPNFPMFEVPYRRNPNFTGREAIISEIHANLNSHQVHTPPQIITGLGGVGKTQIALEYAYRHETEYDLVAWINAEEPATLLADYLTLTQKLKLSVHSSAEQRVFVNVVRHWLENATERWLIIFDNITDSQSIDELLPKQGNGHVLITSRYRDWRSLSSAVFPLVPFEMPETKAFLFNRTGETDENAGEELFELTDGLPLALAQAAAFISKRGLSLQAYTQLYKDQRQELRLREGPPRDYPATLATTWELTFRRFEENSPAGTALLNIFAFLAPDNIPLSIFSQGKSSLPAELIPVFEKPLDLEDLVASLYQYALIERQADGVSIHRMVQEVIQDRLDKNTMQHWLEITLALIDETFKFDEYNVSSWTSCAQLLPHALSTLGHAKNQHIILPATASIWQTIGEYYHKQAEFTQGQTAIENALNLRKQIFGEKSDLVAKSLDYLGELLQARGLFSDASRYHDDALKIYQSNEELRIPMARCLNNIGWLLQVRGQYDRALPYLQQALDNRRSVLGDQHPDTAISLHNLARLFQDQGQYDRALPYFQQALEINRNTLGDHHPNTATSLGSLGSLLQDQGKYDQALPYYQQALDIRRSVLGDQHPDTATSLNNLAILFQDQGQYDRALPYLQQALEINRNTLGDHHPNTATSLGNLGNLFQNQGQYDQALPYFQQALDISRSVLGDQHPDTAKSLGNLGNLFQNQGQYDQALPYLQQTLDISRNTLGDQHPNTATSLNNLAILFQDQGQYDQALPYFQQALDIYRNALGEHHPSTAATLNNIGTIYAKQGKYVRARPYLEQALKIYDQIHEHDHPIQVKILANLAYAMILLKQVVPARDYAMRALKICRETNQEYAECAELDKIIKQIPMIGRKNKQNRNKKRRNNRKKR